MLEVRARDRVVALILYGIALLTVQWTLVEQPGIPSTTLGLWFYNGFASLLLGTRLLNPHFTPPADAATNAFVSAVTMVAAFEAIAQRQPDATILIVLGLLCLSIFLAAVFVLLCRPLPGTKVPFWIVALDRLVRGLGSPNVIFTIVILAAVWIFHRGQPIQIYAILGVWAAVVALHPVESVLGYFSRLSGLRVTVREGRVIGIVVAHQTPGIVLIRQSDEIAVASGTTLLVTDDRGPRLLAIALNYVGRDEGNLLRALTVPVPLELADTADQLVKAVGDGVAARLEFDAALLDNLPDGHAASVLRRMAQFCGIVDQDTSLDHLQFEIVDDRNLAEGRLVETNIAGRPTLYQIIEGVTREEIVQQKNKYGYARAKAQKIGAWNAEQRKFEPVKWLPPMNGPVFLKEVDEFNIIPTAIGHFPGTSYSVSIDIIEAVTHNTAILGILGIGKSFLAIEQVERMIAERIKVVCLDMTNQYSAQLDDYVDSAYEDQKINELHAAGGRGRAHQNKEEGGTRARFRASVLGQLREFLNQNGGRYLRVYNPTQFDVWQQTGNLYQGNAAMASLTPCEITTIITEAALEIVQSMEMTDRARVCLVFEEAHSLVPEWNSVASEGDRTATAATARAILQGRKYGLGCLLITQRTANVTKTILNQCNTIFAMRTFDDTGKEFLSNYIGRDYAGVLPSLEARHAVVFGKASSCENPVLIRLNDREPFKLAFRAAHPLPALPIAGAPPAG